MKFLKAVLIILIVVTITYTVNASNISFNHLSSTTLAVNTTSQALPINGDLLFAFTAIASIGGYQIFKK